MATGIHGNMKLTLNATFLHSHEPLCFLEHVIDLAAESGELEDEAKQKRFLDRKRDFEIRALRKVRAN